MCFEVLTRGILLSLLLVLYPFLFIFTEFPLYMKESRFVRLYKRLEVESLFYINTTVPYDRIEKGIVFTIFTGMKTLKLNCRV